MSREFPERIAMRRDNFPRFLWPGAQDPKDDETVFVREDVIGPMTGRCPKCSTIIETVTADQIEDSIARRMLAAEDIGIKRGEDRVRKRLIEIFTQAQLALSQAINADDFEAAKDAAQRVRDILDAVEFRDEEGMGTEGHWLDTAG